MTTLEKLLSADDIERAVSLLTSRSAQCSRCFKWNSIIIVPPSVFVFNVVAATVSSSSSHYGDRMGIPWLMKQLLKNAHSTIIVFVHLDNHWSLLVRTAICQWYMVDSLLALPAQEHFAIASFIEQGQSHLMVCSPLITQKSIWECGYLALFAFERLLQVSSSQWSSILSNHHGRQKLIGQFTYDTAIERVASLIPPPPTIHYGNNDDDDDDDDDIVMFVPKK